uniref:Uncharacterized protein n=1 Tax=Candidatus Berkiella cookevillensis TaxID=437022 RepID=A0A0Q9YMD1_9GAMM
MKNPKRDCSIGWISNYAEVKLIGSKRHFNRDVLSYLCENAIKIRVKIFPANLILFLSDFIIKKVIKASSTIVLNYASSTLSYMR